MGLARSAGQVLFDLAIMDIDGLVGSRERFGSLIYSYYIQKDEPTKNFFRNWKHTYSHSMVKNNPISYVATLSRIATVELLAKGELDANTSNTDEK